MLTKSSKIKEGFFGRQNVPTRIGELASRLEIGSRMILSRTAVHPAYLAARKHPEGDKLLVGVQAEEGDDSRSIGDRLESVLQETAERGFAIVTGQRCDGLTALDPALPASRTSAMRSTAAARQTGVQGTG